MGQFGDTQSIHKREPFAGRPGMLRITAMILFRDEQTMLDFAGTVRIEDGALQATYHYDPTVAIVWRGAASPTDVSRLLTYAADFPGITHASAEVETVLEEENKGVTA
jgi:hypothetical protein